MKEHVTSGCDQGIPRPAGTPQEGVRSVLQRPSRAERVLLIREQACVVYGLSCADETDYTELRKAFQRGADMCGGLG